MIKEGDLVQLKSGGPTMTAGRFKWFGKFAICHWFETETSNYAYKGELLKEYTSSYFRNREFPVAALKVVEA